MDFSEETPFPKDRFIRTRVVALAWRYDVSPHPANMVREVLTLVPNPPPFRTPSYGPLSGPTATVILSCYPVNPNLAN